MSRVVVFSLCILSLNLSLVNTAFSIDAISMGTINSNFPESRRGGFQTDSITGEVTFNYLLSETDMARVSCVTEESCSTVDKIKCFGNSVPHLASGSCQCADGYKPLDGTDGCVPACPSNTVMVAVSADNYSCYCKESDIEVGFTGDPRVCDEESSGKGCGTDPRENASAFGEPTQKKISNYLACKRDEAVKKANQACLEAQGQIENSNCTSSLNVNVNMSDFTNSGSSMEACRSLSKTAQRIIENTTNEIARCNGIISKESSRCPSSVTVPSAKGTTSPISVSRFLSFNNLANKARSNLEIQRRIHKGASDSFKKRAEQCIAAFEQDPYPILDAYPDSNPRQPPDTQTSQASRKTTNWSGLAQTAAQAFESLNGSGLEASVDGGELGSSSNAPNAASSPSFKQSNNNNGGLRESPYSRFNDEDGGGGFNGDGNPEDSIRNSQRTHGNRNSRNQASQAGLTAQRGHGGPSGVNGGGGGGGGGEVKIMVVASLLPQMLIKEIKPEEGLLQLRKETWF